MYRGGIFLNPCGFGQTIECWNIRVAGANEFPHRFVDDTIQKILLRCGYHAAGWKLEIVAPPEDQGNRRLEAT